MKTFKIFTLGCKANQYDSQLIREQLVSAGMRELNNGTSADCCIINTCTVTKSADRQSRNLIRAVQHKSPGSRIVVIGCYAHLNADAIRSIKGVDFIVNNDEKFTLRQRLFPDQPQQPCIDELGIHSFQGHTRAFVKVQDGCDNFCSFCKVPYARGRSRSRPLAAIKAEVRSLVENGHKEVVLTGICLGDYGRKLAPACDLVDLLDVLEKNDGLERIRLSSIEPKDISSRLIDKIASSKKICSHLHIPFQSGDDQILEAMNRRDSRQRSIDTVNTLKQRIAGIGISADIMIGFPGEGEQEFQNTVSFLKEIEPMRVHLFTFSSRDYTRLSNTENTIAASVLKERYAILEKLSERLSASFKRCFLKQALEVLFEEKKNGFWQGYSRNYLLVLTKDTGHDLTNVLANVTIEKIANSNLYGHLGSV